ncbi:hypothetical protein MASR2M66_00420 [Chloroflexota bacterium]
MTIPAILLGLVIALLTGALFHVFRGGSGWRLLLYFGLSILGFALGQMVSLYFGMVVFRVGTMDIGAGMIGSLLVLGLGDWLSRIKPVNESSV